MGSRKPGRVFSCALRTVQLSWLLLNMLRVEETLIDKGAT